jgi:hypothetical protein
VTALELEGGEVADRRVAPPWVVPAFDPLEHREVRLALRLKATTVQQLALQRREEALRISVIVNALIGIVNTPIGDREHGRGPAVL